MKGAIIFLNKILYRTIIKPVFFLFDPLVVHERITRIGQILGSFPPIRWLLAMLFRVRYKALTQNLFGILFENPLGLAAGYDYEGRLTAVLPSVGFGFGTLGTLTHEAYGGNPPPLLGRLPKSKSLMVNKGFKNDGVEATLERLKGSRFAYPVGVSIGLSNSRIFDVQRDAIEDILKSFESAEKSGVPFAYYELNISCPNLKSPVDFYKPEHLRELLESVGKRRALRPVFIKMPISESDEEILSMMEEIVKHPFVKGVILGNLQRNRNHPALLKEEVEKFSVGNWSGMACQSRSDELISLVYGRYREKIKIIGCGGVFCAEDAYRKIALGASLVQMVTGLIFEGPQVVADINRGIAARIKREGYKNVGELIGSAAR